MRTNIVFVPNLSHSTFVTQLIQSNRMKKISIVPTCDVWKRQDHFNHQTVDWKLLWFVRGCWITQDVSRSCTCEPLDSVCEVDTVDSKIPSDEANHLSSLCPYSSQSYTDSSVFQFSIYDPLRSWSNYFIWARSITETKLYRHTARQDTLTPSIPLHIELRQQIQIFDTTTRLQNDEIHRPMVQCPVGPIDSHL